LGEDGVLKNVSSFPTPQGVPKEGRKKRLGIPRNVKKI
jgi:hypothetical protein